MEKSKASLQSSPLNPQRFNVVDLLHSFCSQYKRMLFLYANAIFDADAHAAEVGWVSFCIGDVEAASTNSSAERKNGDQGTELTVQW